MHRKHTKGDHKKKVTIPLSALSYLLIVGFIFWQVPYLEGDFIGPPLIGALLYPISVGLFLTALSGGVGIIFVLPVFILYGLCIVGALDFIQRRYTARPWQGIALIAFFVLALIIRDVGIKYHMTYATTYSSLSFTPTIEECKQKFTLPFANLICAKMVAQKKFDAPTFAYCDQMKGQERFLCMYRVHFDFQTDDPSICDRLGAEKNDFSRGSGYDDCIVGFARTQKNPALCKKLPPDTYFYDEQSCLVEVAKEKHDRSICALIKDTNQHQRCVDATK